MKLFVKKINVYRLRRRRPPSPAAPSTRPCRRQSSTTTTRDLVRDERVDPRLGTKKLLLSFKKKTYVEIPHLHRQPPASRTTRPLRPIFPLLKTAPFDASPRPLSVAYFWLKFFDEDDSAMGAERQRQAKISSRLIHSNAYVYRFFLPDNHPKVYSIRCRRISPCNI